jgi:hypothetical protein
LKTIISESANDAALTQIAAVGPYAATTMPANPGPITWESMKPDMFRDCARSGEYPARSESPGIIELRAARPGLSRNAPPATSDSSMGKLSRSSMWKIGISAVVIPLRRSAIINVRRRPIRSTSAPPKMAATTGGA